jgi:hypothetical protein
MFSREAAGVIHSTDRLLEVMLRIRDRQRIMAG